MRHNITGRIAIAVLIGAALLTGCGSHTPAKSASDSDQAPTESSSASPSAKAGDATKAIQAYFSAMAGQNPETLRHAVRNNTVPGSLAAVYGIQQAGQMDAGIDGGTTSEKETMASVGNGDVKLCDPSGDKTVCYRYGNFAADQQGRLSAFTIDNRSLKGRLMLGNGKPHRTPLGDVSLVSAYVTQAGELSVVTKVHTAGEKVIYGQNGTTYRDRTGRQRNSSSFSGPGEISPNSRATVALFFSGPIKLGGDLTIDLTQDGGDYATSYVQIKTSR